MFVADVLELLLGDLREVFLMLLVELRPFVLMQSLLSASKSIIISISGLAGECVPPSVSASYNVLSFFSVPL